MNLIKQASNYLLGLIFYQWSTFNRSLKLYFTWVFCGRLVKKSRFHAKKYPRQVSKSNMVIVLKNSQSDEPKEGVNDIFSSFWFHNLISNFPRIKNVWSQRDKIYHLRTKTCYHLRLAIQTLLIFACFFFVHLSLLFHIKDCFIDINRSRSSLPQPCRTNSYVIAIVKIRNRPIQNLFNCPQWDCSQLTFTCSKQQ